MYMVGEMGPEGEKPIGEVKSMKGGRSDGDFGLLAELWQPKEGGAQGRKPMTLEAWMLRKVENTPLGSQNAFVLA